MSEGYDVEIFFLHEDERSEIVKSILTSKGIAVGDPTINDVPYPSHSLQRLLQQLERK